MRELSPSRAELLRLFLTNPEGSFYMQQIGRILGNANPIFRCQILGSAREIYAA